MAYVVAAKWIARPEEVDEVARCIAAMVPLSRAEPGMLMYQPHRDPDDPTVFYLYEQYVDEDAYKAHVESPLPGDRIRRRDPASGSARALLLLHHSRLAQITHMEDASGASLGR
jgi:quinol monooxygenase YgiN